MIQAEHQKTRWQRIHVTHNICIRNCLLLLSQVCQVVLMDLEHVCLVLSRELIQGFLLLHIARNIIFEQCVCEHVELISVTR